MVAGASAQGEASTSSERPLPPIAELATGSMALIVIGGIYLAAYVPRTVPLLPAVALLVLAALVMVANVVLLSRLRPFAWHRFFQVFKWTLLAYAVIAGMIGYAFVVDGTPGSVLAVLLLMLLVFAVDIPLLLAFSVARYAEPDA
ncbi:MAG: hypothetical protein NVS2B16_33200 [Chloroflexota bacterium]